MCGRPVFAIILEVAQHDVLIGLVASRIAFRYFCFQLLISLLQCCILDFQAEVCKHARVNVCVCVCVCVCVERLCVKIQILFLSFVCL